MIWTKIHSVQSAIQQLGSNSAHQLVKGWERPLLYKVVKKGFFNLILSGILALVFILFLGITSFGQGATLGYNPFVPKNLDDTIKLNVVTVVESSYHRYWIKGDPNYKDTSTYVWYVENGTFGNYDSSSDTWVSMSAQPFYKGYTIELPGMRIDTIKNASQIWVRWDDGAADSIGYIAVYERSPDSCVVEDQLTGFKHNIIARPEVWLVDGNIEECADQKYAVNVKFNNINDFSFPYELSYTYPGSDGMPLSGQIKVNSMAEMKTGLSYIFDLDAVHEINATMDETYTISIDELRDKYGSTGFIAPLGPPKQYAKLTLTVFHLPQTGGMAMD
jgi:hypothetical protein